MPCGGRRCLPLRRRRCSPGRRPARTAGTAVRGRSTTWTRRIRQPRAVASRMICIDRFTRGSGGQRSAFGEGPELRVLGRYRVALLRFQPERLLGGPAVHAQQVDVAHCCPSRCSSARAASRNTRTETVLSTSSSGTRMDGKSARFRGLALDDDLIAGEHHPVAAVERMRVAAEHYQIPSSRSPAGRLRTRAPLTRKFRRLPGYAQHPGNYP